MTAMTEPQKSPVVRPSTALERVVLVAGVLGLLLILGGGLATVALGAAGVGDPIADGCARSDPPGASWPGITSLLMWAGVALAAVTLIAGRHVPFVLRLPAMIAAACALPVIVVSTMFAFISYGGEC